jgi:hypothetical protein
VEIWNLSKEIEAMGVQPDRVERAERQQGGPGGHPGSQSGGTQVGEQTGERQVEQSAGHGPRGDRPADPILVDSPEVEEGQPMEDE